MSHHNDRMNETLKCAGMMMVALRPGERPARCQSASNPLEVILVVLAVAVAHLLPFAGVVGCPLFASDGCETIAWCSRFLPPSC